MWDAVVTTSISSRLVQVTDCGQPDNFGIPTKNTQPNDQERKVILAGMPKQSNINSTQYIGSAFKMWLLED